jgi:hypothetical protein
VLTRCQNILDVLERITENEIERAGSRHFSERWQQERTYGKASEVKLQHVEAGLRARTLARPAKSMVGAPGCCADDGAPEAAPSHAAASIVARRVLNRCTEASEAKGFVLPLLHPAPRYNPRPWPGREYRRGQRASSSSSTILMRPTRRHPRSPGFIGFFTICLRTLMGLPKALRPMRCQREHWPASTAGSGQGITVRAPL